MVRGEWFMDKWRNRFYFCLGEIKKLVDGEYVCLILKER